MRMNPVSAYETHMYHTLPGMPLLQSNPSSVPCSDPRSVPCSQTRPKTPLPPLPFRIYQKAFFVRINPVSARETRMYYPLSGMLPWRSRTCGGSRGGRRGGP